MARQIAVLVAVAMLGLIAVVTALVVRQQQRETDASLRATAATADDVGDPPAGAWLVLVTERGTASSPGFPASLAPALASARRRTAEGRSALVTLRGSDVPDYRLLTVHERERTVQVVADLGPQQRRRDQLLRTMGLGALASLAVAATVGVVLGRRAVRPLAQALGLQRAFVADASHELRTPLTLLSTRAQLLHRELTTRGADAQAVADAYGVVTDVQRLGEVVEDLLIAADPRSELEHVPVDVVDIAAQVVASAAAEAEMAQVRLVLSTPTPAQVFGAPAALRRAVLSLLDNAIDHTPPGGEVRVEVRRRRGEVVVRVADSGPGVAPEHQGHLLTRFHSGGQRSGRAHYGLGLALTHDVANRHGGHLRLVPSVSGAVFELVLPVGRASKETGIPRKG
jgi:two-component system OmpR family sensor kinase